MRNSVVNQAVFFLLSAQVPIAEICEALGISRFKAYRVRSQWEKSKAKGIDDTEGATALAVLLPRRSDWINFVRLMKADDVEIREVLSNLVRAEAFRRGPKFS